MNLALDYQPATLKLYKSASQIARVITERWVGDTVYCPNCGRFEIAKFPNNQPVADFYCVHCREEFELKSQRNRIGSKVVDGAYCTMIERLCSNERPNMFLLRYDLRNDVVLDFLVIPKQFFVPTIVEKRNPLRATARRAGWVGCSILVRDIPQVGKVYLVRNRVVESRETVLLEWKRTIFLREKSDAYARGWLLDVIACIEKIGRREFVLNEIYEFEHELREKHPDNHHIKAKIRQQLQVLRDNGYLEFVGRGRYRLV